MTNVRHLFKADGMPTLTLAERTLLRELTRFDLQADVALQEARQAVTSDDPALGITAARRLLAIGSFLGELAHHAEASRLR